MLEYLTVSLSHKFISENKPNFLNLSRLTTIYRKKFTLLFI